MRHPRIVLTGATLLLYLFAGFGGAEWSTGSDLPSAPSGVIRLQFFGMHVGIHDTGLTTPILPPIIVGAMGKCVVSDWVYVERAPRSYNWGQIDACTNWAAHFGIRYFESWNSMTAESVGATDPTTDSRCWETALPKIYSCLGVMTAEGERQWVNFNAAMALRYKNNPGMDFYEGWNEPPYAHKTGVPPIKAALLAQYERDRVNAIRANDPNAKVASPAFIIEPQFPSYAIFMDDFLKSNPPAYDYYNVHINYPNAPEDEIPLIAQFKQILAKNGVESPPIYATEAGRPNGSCPAWPSYITPDLQQAFIARMELIYWSQGVSRHYWYAYDTCGRLTDQPRSKTLNPAGIAYGNVENWMVGATMNQPCAGPKDRWGVWTCGLTKPDGTRTLVVWDTSQSCTSGNCTTSSYRYDPGYKKYYALGNRTSMRVAGATIPIGAKPILLSQ